MLSTHGYRYYVLFVDYSSRYTWIYPNKIKFEVFKTFLAFKTLVESLFKKTIKYFQSDGGKEYDNTSLAAFLIQHGIYFQKSAPYAQQQNVVA